jgi:nitrous oxidase accessory protein
MKRILIILLLLSFYASQARTIIVGKNHIVTSLRKAVALAASKDTILLEKGLYKEGNIVINKPLYLIGEGEPILDGDNRYEILTVSTNGAIIKGIKFQNAGYSSTLDFAAIGVIDAQNIIIENNSFSNTFFAIHFANSSEALIAVNTIVGTFKSEQTSGNGIHLWKCNNIVVENNNIQGHRDGIYFEFVTNSIIQQNNSHNNIRYGLHFMFSNNDAYLENTFNNNGAGVAVMYSHHVLMQKNVFENNWGGSAYGLLLKEISDGTIVQNQFVQNTAGIVMESTNRIDVQLNSYRGNGYALRIQASCNENTVHHNNFQGNTFDVATNGTLMLNEFYNNYWDKYEGYDMNKDIIGDVPYHPVSMYSMVIEQNPNAVILLRSFMVSLLDKAEKAIPSLTPENMTDNKPLMKPLAL